MEDEPNSTWKKIGQIITVLAALVAVLAYLKIIPLCNPFTGCAPQFKFTYEGTGKPVYEVGDGLAYSDENNQAILPFSITVEVLQFSGREYSGEMDVVIEWLDIDQNKHQELVGKWDSFRNQYQMPVRIELFPSSLFKYANFPVGIDTYTWDTQEPLKGYFDLVVRYNDGTELARETVTVVYAPWYQEVLLDSAVIRVNQPLTAHVKVTNLGEPAKFKITGIVYDTSNPDFSSMTNDQSWWAGKTWTTSVFERDIITDTAVGTHKDYVTTINVPADAFQEGHTYALAITVVKEISYLKLADSSTTWSNSDESWRYRNNNTYLSIFVLK